MFCLRIPKIEYMEPRNKTIQRMIYSESDETWILACHQLILFILVAGRAFMPNSKAWLNGPFTVSSLLTDSRPSNPIGPKWMVHSVDSTEPTKGW